MPMDHHPHLQKSRTAVRSCWGSRAATWEGWVCAFQGTSVLESSGAFFVRSFLVPSPRTRCPPCLQNPGCQGSCRPPGSLPPFLTCPEGPRLWPDLPRWQQRAGKTIYIEAGVSRGTPIACFQADTQVSCSSSPVFIRISLGRS